jgi:hypothetical protein
MIIWKLEYWFLTLPENVDFSTAEAINIFRMNPNQKLWVRETKYRGYFISTGKGKLVPVLNQLRTMPLKTYGGVDV